MKEGILTNGDPSNPSNHNPEFRKDLLLDVLRWMLPPCWQSVYWKQNLLITTLDTQKAFDVVDHNFLLRKLYLDGVRGDDWLLLKGLFLIAFRESNGQGNYHILSI